MMTELTGTKSVLSGVATGGAYLFASASTIDSSSLVPIGLAVAIMLAVAGATWRVSKWVAKMDLLVMEKINKLEQSLENLRNERKYDMDMAERKHVKPKHDAEAPTPTKRMYHATVLVCDDDPNDRFVVRRSLERVGYMVVEAKSLQDARDVLRSHTIDCILMDLKLPDSPSDRTIPDLLRDFPRAKVIALTGSEDPQIQAKALAEGADAFVFKADTADPDYLPRMIQKAMGRSAIRQTERK